MKDLIKGVRVDGDTVIASVKGGNEAARQLCGELVAMIDVRISGTEARVCEDIAKRQQVGLAKYGTSVEANPLSLREWLQHAYEETLDKAVYLRRAIEEMDKP